LTRIRKLRLGFLTRSLNAITVVSTNTANNSVTFSAAGAQITLWLPSNVVRAVEERLPEKDYYLDLPVMT